MHMGVLIMYMGFYLFYLYYDSFRLTRHQATSRRSTWPCSWSSLRDTITSSFFLSQINISRLLGSLASYHLVARL